MPWYWCSKDNGDQCDSNWRCHKPSECQGKAHKLKKDDTLKRKTKTTCNNDMRKLNLTKVMNATVTDETKSEGSQVEDPIYLKTH
jgi:hypothetical protein